MVPLLSNITRYFSWSSCKSMKTPNRLFWIQHLFDCKPCLNFFFVLCGVWSRAAYRYTFSLLPNSKKRYTFYLFTLSKNRWRSVFPWLRFFRSNSLFLFYSPQHQVHIRHRRGCDEQKAVVVVKHYCQGYEHTRNVLVRKCISEA